MAGNGVTIQELTIDENQCQEWMKIARAGQVCLKQALIDILNDPQINGLPKNPKDRDEILKKFRQDGEEELKDQILFDQLDLIVPKDGGESQIRRLCIPNLIFLINRLTSINDSGTLSGLSDALQIHQDIYQGSITSMDDETYQSLWQRLHDVLVVLKYSEMSVFHYLKEASIDEVEAEQIEILDERCRSLNPLDENIETHQKELTYLMELVKSYSLREQEIDVICSNKPLHVVRDDSK